MAATGPIVQIVLGIVSAITLYLVVVSLARTRGMVYVTSSIDGKRYLVNDSPSKAQAADALAIINQRILQLIRSISTKRPNERCVQLIQKRYKPNRTELSEGQADPKYTTYTVNKGESIVFCLKPRQGSETVYDINLLMFVAIHELAHIGCPSRDNHNEEFQAVFRMLLQEAITIGVYTYQDYSQKPVEYCNLSISHSGL